MNETVRVVKVGGSLFSFAEMPERVHAWCDRQPPATTVFIGGGGDLVQPLKAGVIQESKVAADLVDLCKGRHPGRTSDTEITLFKSVGTAIEDLAAAKLMLERM